jgi:hypothetical protein
MHERTERIRPVVDGPDTAEAMIRPARDRETGGRPYGLRALVFL